MPALPDNQYWNRITSGSGCFCTLARPHDRNLETASCHFLSMMPLSSFMILPWPNMSFSKFDNLADRFARMKAIETLVDLIEGNTMRHQFLDRQFTAPMQTQKARNIAGGYA